MIILLFCSFFAQSQERPKLVVGIVVDQMRYDYIYRFGMLLEKMALKN